MTEVFTIQDRYRVIRLKLKSKRDCTGLDDKELRMLKRVEQKIKRLA